MSQEEDRNVSTSRSIALAILKAINVSPKTVVDVKLDLSGPLALLQVTHTVPSWVNGMITTQLQEFDLVRRLDQCELDVRQSILEEASHTNQDGRITYTTDDTGAINFGFPAGQNTRALVLLETPCGFTSGWVVSKGALGTIPMELARQLVDVRWPKADSSTGQSQD